MYFRWMTGKIVTHTLCNFMLFIVIYLFAVIRIRERITVSNLKMF